VNLESATLVDVLKEIGFSRQRWPFTFALLDLAFDPLRNSKAYDRFYRARRDPWNYEADVGERQRHRLAAEMLDRVRNGRSFSNTLEIGCSEGVFTELLAPLSEVLWAVDFSTLALQRARQRRQWDSGVGFMHFDLRHDPVPGNFELVVVMDVLTSFRRPGALRAAQDKIVKAVRPGGYLLVTDHRQELVFETAWWARRLGRGGKWIISAFSEYSALTQIDARCTPTHALALFRRRPAPA
jgi:SAM-dependent methyltransferase